jgi:hypothetical protein
MIVSLAIVVVFVLLAVLSDGSLASEASSAPLSSQSPTLKLHRTNSPAAGHDNHAKAAKRAKKGRKKKDKKLEDTAGNITSSSVLKNEGQETIDIIQTQNSDVPGAHLDSPSKKPLTKPQERETSQVTRLPQADIAHDTLHATGHSYPTSRNFGTNQQRERSSHDTVATSRSSQLPQNKLNLNSSPLALQRGDRSSPSPRPKQATINSNSNSNTTPWIEEFVTKHRSDKLLLIPRDYMADQFNLHNLGYLVEREVNPAIATNKDAPGSSFKYFRAAWRMILDPDYGDPFVDGNDSKHHDNPMLQQAAEVLYLYTHARYVISQRGLDAVRRLLHSGTWLLWSSNE